VSQKRILTVTDDPLTAAALRDGFDHAGFAVKWVPTTYTSSAYLEFNDSSKEGIVAIVLDWRERVPGEADSFLQEAAAQPTWKGIPVVITTALPGQKVEALGGLWPELKYRILTMPDFEQILCVLNAAIGGK
jgi:DNA-binding response OmpR family regulator